MIRGTGEKDRHAQVKGGPLSEAIVLPWERKEWTHTGRERGSRDHESDAKFDVAGGAGYCGESLSAIVNGHFLYILSSP